MLEQVRGQNEAIAEIRRQNAAGLMRVNGKLLYRFHPGGGSQCNICQEHGKLWWAFAESCNDLCYNMWQICSECENLSPFELDDSFVRPHHHNKDGSICWKRNYGLERQDTMRDGCIDFDDCDSLLARTQAELQECQEIYLNFDSGSTRASKVQDFLASFHVKHASDDIILHLIDSGSTCYLSPRKEHLFIEHVCHMQVKGVGSETCKTMSPLIYTFLDMNNEYQSFQWPAVYYTTAIGFPIMATGPMEKQGFTFVLHSRNAHIIAPTGSVIPVLTDPNTGFHWAVERIAARPTVEGKSRMIAAFLRHPNHAGVKLINTPVVPVNPFIEKKPSHPPTSFDLDRILQASSHFASLTTGENNGKLSKHGNKGKLTKHVSFPVTRAQRSAERQIEGDAEDTSDNGGAFAKGVESGAAGRKVGGASETDGGYGMFIDNNEQKELDQES
jgi:hypothetical protein